MINEGVVQISLALTKLTYVASLIGVCVYLRKNRSWWFDYIATFILFGTVGGWIYAVAIAPLPVVYPSVEFIKFTFLALLFSSLILAFKKSKKKFQWLMLSAGGIYPLSALIGGFFGTL